MFKEKQKPPPVWRGSNSNFELECPSAWLKSYAYLPHSPSSPPPTPHTSSPLLISLLLLLQPQPGTGTTFSNRSTASPHRAPKPHSGALPELCQGQLGLPGAGTDPRTYPGPGHPETQTRNTSFLQAFLFTKTVPSPPAFFFFLQKPLPSSSHLSRSHHDPSSLSTQYGNPNWNCSPFSSLFPPPPCNLLWVFVSLSFECV